MDRSAYFLAFVVAVTDISQNLIAKETGELSVKDFNFELNSGDLMPVVGLGTWQIQGTEEIKNSLDFAFGAGYRHIDTAQFYENEEDIGKALKELLPKHNISREDIFITSKINITEEKPCGYKSVQDSLTKLQLTYIDLYLIHNPAIITKINKNSEGIPTTVEFSTGPGNIQIRDQKWQSLVKAKGEGLVRNIGVSNYAVKHLKEVLENDHGVKPAVNQIAWNPFNQPRDILELCTKENIIVVGYSSLGGTRDTIKLRDDFRIAKIAEKLGKTPSQVLLRWVLQNHIAIIPKATSQAHIEEDIDLDFVVPDEDVVTLNSMEQKAPLFDIDNID